MSISPACQHIGISRQAYYKQGKAMLAKALELAVKADKCANRSFTILTDRFSTVWVASRRLTQRTALPVQ